MCDPAARFDRLPSTASLLSASRASVTPANADTTTTIGIAARAAMMPSAWRTATLSASDAPPNLCTSGAWERRSPLERPPEARMSDAGTVIGLGFGDAVLLVICCVCGNLHGVASVQAKAEPTQNV
jgi:hypothetical protein